MESPSADAASFPAKEDPPLDDPSAMEGLLSPRSLALDDAGAASSPEEIDAGMVDFAAATGGASADLEAFLILMAVMVIKQEGAARLKESVGFATGREQQSSSFGFGKSESDFGKRKEGRAVKRLPAYLPDDLSRTYVLPKSSATTDTQLTTNATNHRLIRQSHNYPHYPLNRYHEDSNYHRRCYRFHCGSVLRIGKAKMCLFSFYLW